MAGRLAGKNAIVTGAASGLGRASAELFAAEGATVACVDIDHAGAESTREAITSQGGRAIAIHADLTVPEDAERMTKACLDELDSIDVVYACAGIAGPGDAASTPVDRWEHVIAVNLTSKWLSFRYALPHMCERGRGSVIVQASIGAFVGAPHNFAYSAAKGGCISMIKQAAVDFGPHGVRVNGVAPALVPTPLTDASYRAGGAYVIGATPEEGYRRAVQLYPLGRVGTGVDVAQAACYLASDESAWTTGHVLVVDGGFTAGHPRVPQPTAGSSAEPAR